ncbi:MAG TPA: histidine kinase [Terriglobales bacterium]|nr:histidine kinase [Terriglobales bacterium]
MHPILSHPRQMLLYLVLWIPLTALLGYLFRASGYSVQEVAILLGVLAPLYALMCLLAWYPCRATPLQRAGSVRIAATLTAAAVVIAGTWMFFAMIYVSVLESFESLRGLASHAGMYRMIFGMGLLLYLVWAAYYYVLLTMEASRQLELRATEARVLARDSELRALKAQINPHFIFNSLHSISALTTVDATRAREMCITLADFLRATLGLGQKTIIPLSEELDLVHRYLTVEKIRFGSRLMIEEKVDDVAVDCVIPPLILQPLVENAIQHGVAHLPEGACIRLSITAKDDRLTIAMENNFDPEIKPKKRSGIGLANVRERIAIRYGDAANFQAAADGDLFRVNISLPAARSIA